ncbi:MAG: ethanolamine permease [Bdellovibrionales bacterium]|nr:ethanolamine permease [Bdellovibrionales bacterium]
MSQIQTPTNSSTEAPHLQRSLGAFHLWGLAVGLVISGEYFGWSYGWSVSGPIGFLVSTLIITVLYITLVFSFTELTTSIPDAGGPYAYATRALGSYSGFMAGFATTVEFLFAPPAIAFALGGYLHVIVPEVSIPVAATVVLLVFGAVNLLGVKHSARFESFVTVLAVIELLIFLLAVLPHFQLENFTRDGFQGGWYGVFAAIPYAIWFFLAIEGVAMAAEEVHEPAKNIPKGYLSGIATLVFLALGVMFAAGGAGDWKKLATMDYPIPEAVGMALGADNPWVKAFAGIGLFGLVASLNGIVLGASRQIYAVARAGILPRSLSHLSKAGVPNRAVIFTTVVGIVSIASGKTAQLITLSAIGAVSMYLISMVSLLALRKKEPNLHRPFKAPLYPVFPIVAAALSAVSAVAMVWFNLEIAVVFVLLGVLATIVYRFRSNN